MLQAQVSANEYTAVLLQGAGTFAVESVLQTGLPRGRPKLLALSNGAYGDRIAAIAKYMDVETVLLRFDELEPMNLSRVKQVGGEGQRRSKRSTHWLCFGNWHCGAGFACVPHIHRCSGAAMIQAVLTVRRWAEALMSIPRCSMPTPT